MVFSASKSTSPERAARGKPKSCWMTFCANRAIAASCRRGANGGRHEGVPAGTGPEARRCRMAEQGKESSWPTRRRASRHSTEPIRSVEPSPGHAIAAAWTTRRPAALPARSQRAAGGRALHTEANTGARIPGSSTISGPDALLAIVGDWIPEMARSLAFDPAITQIPPRDGRIRIGQAVVVDQGLAEFPWRSSISARQGRRFDKSNRCLVPASAFFEFIGKKYPKAKYRFTLTDAPFIAIAELWREGKSNQPPSFTMLTTELGPDVVPYHNRLAVVLRPADWAAWIDPTVPEAVC